MNVWHDPEVLERLQRVSIHFNDEGYDRFGISRDRLADFYSAMALVYRHYLRVTTFGVENIPVEGGAIVVGNHAGGIAFDAAMVLTAMLLEAEPPRIGHGMVDHFLAKWPFATTLLSRVGQFSGLPANAEQLLDDGRALVVFPEGHRGTGKLFRERYQLQPFGTGFARLAMQCNVPVIPFGFIGAEEAFPTLFHLKKLAKLLRAPYVPVPPQLVPLPLPLACQIYFGEPIYLSGEGRESDTVVASDVQRVRNAVQRLVDRGRAARPGEFMLRRMPGDEEPLTRSRR